MARPGFIPPHLPKMGVNEPTRAAPSVNTAVRVGIASRAEPQHHYQKSGNDYECRNASDWDTSMKSINTVTTVTAASASSALLSKFTPTFTPYSSSSNEVDLIELSPKRSLDTEPQQHHQHHQHSEYSSWSTASLLDGPENEPEHQDQDKGTKDRDEASNPTALEDTDVESTDDGFLSNADSSLTSSDDCVHDCSLSRGLRDVNHTRGLPMAVRDVARKGGQIWPQLSNTAPALTLKAPPSTVAPVPANAPTLPKATNPAKTPARVKAPTPTKFREKASARAHASARAKAWVQAPAPLPELSVSTHPSASSASRSVSKDDNMSLLQSSVIPAERLRTPDQVLGVCKEEAKKNPQLFVPTVFTRKSFDG